MVCESFRVDQVLAFVLQFHIGAHGVDIQSDAGFLKFRGLVVQSLGKRDARGCRITRGKRAKHLQVLIDDGIDHNLASRLFVGSRFTPSLLANLVTAN